MESLKPKPERVRDASSERSERSRKALEAISEAAGDVPLDQPRKPNRPQKHLQPRREEQGTGRRPENALEFISETAGDTPLEGPLAEKRVDWEEWTDAADRRRSKAPRAHSKK